MSRVQAFKLTVAAAIAACVVSACTVDADDPELPTGFAEAPGAADGLADPMFELVQEAERLAQEHPGRAIPPREGLVYGGDVSWPNCRPGIGIPERETKGLPMPTDEAEFVIIGLTNGPGYFMNPCLDVQVAWAKQHQMMTSVYSVISFPDDLQLARHGDEGPFDPTTPLGRLRNAGHAQGTFNMNSMRVVGVQSPAIWLDIEPVKDWEWSDDTAANVAVIEGAIRAYTDAGYRLGIYSVPSLWRNIAGTWSPGLPEWRSAGQTSREQALTRCDGDQHAFQGGEPILAQWWDDERDHNLTCPGVGAHLGRWFHQY
ncbi:hypothetical protein [Nocardioides limicola]|uniref:hypothetical protein n=1 Tax=Nocardioides limicola TaxID=2803368 RepID=UPI00193C4C4F|nr:hypothetical protein [Nocardioides sp. DJM-14]